MHQQMTTAQPHFTHPVLQANTQNQRLWLRSISRQSLELVLDPENSRQWYSAYLQVLARKGCNLPKQPKTGKAEGQQEGEGVTWQRYLPPPGSTSPTPTLAGEPGKRAWLCLPCGVHTAQARGSTERSHARGGGPRDGRLEELRPANTAQEITKHGWNENLCTRAHPEKRPDSHRPRPHCGENPGGEEI